MKRLLMPMVVLTTVLLVGCNRSVPQSKVTILAHYSITALENDHSLLVVDLQGEPSIANATRALNDIAIHYGKIIGDPMPYCEIDRGDCNPTTHLFVRIEPFVPPRTFEPGPTPYPDYGTPSRAGAK